jgi:hypothetical protein
MSAPYLNRGESIILTTHRVSVGSAVYDAMMTNERLILMDSRYAQFEPRIIPFPGIVTVKGGKASTGEPAIILTLEEPSELVESGQVCLIFVQQVGEKRKQEREVWVKKLIELVIAAREQAIQKTVEPVKKKTGMQPSVRRWEAPEPPRPHVSVTDQSAPLPEKVVVTEEEPDSMDFFFEEKPAEKRKSPEENLPFAPEPEVTTATREMDPSLQRDVVKEAEPITRETIPKAEPQWPKVKVPVPDTPVSPGDIPAVPPEGGMTWKSDPDAFASIVQAAAEPLQVHAERETLPPERVPSEEKHKPMANVKNEIPTTEALPTRERPVIRTTSLPDTTPGEKPVSPPVPPTPGALRELSGTYAPDLTTKAAPVPPKENHQASSSEKKKYQQGIRTGYQTILTLVLFIIAIMVLLGVVLFAVNYLQGSVYSNTVVTIAPTTPNTQTKTPLPAEMEPAGVRVFVSYPGLFTGTVGSSGNVRQVSGTGNQTFPVLMTSSIVQTTIRKQDNSGDPLIVEILDNSTLLARQTVTAPRGEISLLIDTKTAAPPGLGNGKTAGNTPLLGNGSLIYY